MSFKIFFEYEFEVGSLGISHLITGAVIIFMNFGTAIPSIKAGHPSRITLFIRSGFCKAYFIAQ